MPDWAVIFFLAVILLLIGVSVLRFRDGRREAIAERKRLDERLDRIEQRLDEREPEAGPIDDAQAGGSGS